MLVSITVITAYRGNARIISHHINIPTCRSTLAWRSLKGGVKVRQTSLDAFERADLKEWGGDSRPSISSNIYDQVSLIWILLLPRSKTIRPQHAVNWADTDSRTWKQSRRLSDFFHVLLGEAVLWLPVGAVIREIAPLSIQQVKQPFITTYVSIFI